MARSSFFACLGKWKLYIVSVSYIPILVSLVFCLLFNCTSQLYKQADQILDLLEERDSGVSSSPSSGSSSAPESSSPTRPTPSSTSPFYSSDLNGFTSSPTGTTTNGATGAPPSNGLGF